MVPTAPPASTVAPIERGLVRPVVPISTKFGVALKDAPRLQGQQQLPDSAAAAAAVVVVVMVRAPTTATSAAAHSTRKPQVDAAARPIAADRGCGPARVGG